MIRFEAVTKRYSLQSAPAVDRLDLEIDDGTLTVLVGPSGCGKTTSLRMINRLEDLTEGSISIDDRDIMATDKTKLRRGIGYVMQHSGLFPHRTIRDNIATVPLLLNWDKARIGARVEELIDLVGLTPDMLDRYPHALSGGQQQRVGVARALAADPPIMLMDEPFAAVDPIVRTHLQDEFLRLQRQLNKTIVFVTHDIDEAIKLGDHIAMFEQGGSLAQHATPAEILSAPASEFVTDFLGADRELKRLALMTVAGIETERGPVVAVGDSGDTARRTAAHHDSDWVVVVGPDERLQGWLALDTLDGDSVGANDVRAFKYTVTADDSLRTALNAMMACRIGVAPRLDADGRYEGLLTQAGMTEELA